MSLSDSVIARFPQWVQESMVVKGDESIAVKREGVLEVCRVLKESPFDFNMLMDLFAVDYLHWPEKPSRFEVVYNLYSLQNKTRLFMKVAVSEKEAEIPSVCGLWPAANWFEREVYDMMGIRFKGHPNLKRILMYEGFEGHPLRKDYPFNKRQPILGPVC